MTIFRAALTVGWYTGLSRILGLIREILLSYVLGTSGLSDAFLVAFKLPNFFRRFFAEGAMSTAFIPLFGEKLVKSPFEDTQAFANNVFSTLFWVLCFLSFVAIVFMPWVMKIVAPGFLTTSERFIQAVDFSRITFLYILCASLTALCGGILNSFQKFTAMAAMPMVLNMVMIAALMLKTESSLTSTYLLSWGVLIAGVLQFLWVYICCCRQGLMLTITVPSFNADLQKVLRLMGPSALGAGIFQVNLFIDTILASFLPVGSISYLYYADRLNQLPLSMIGLAISTAVLPLLSKQIKEGNPEAVHKSQRHAIALALHLSLPITTALICLAGPIIRIVYGHGQFGEDAIDATTLTLIAFSVGVPGYVLVKVLSSFFFARQDTKTPVRFAMISIACNLSLNLLLIPYLSCVGIALATALASWVNAGLLAMSLYRKSLLDRVSWDSKNIMKAAALCFICGTFLLLSSRLFHPDLSVMVMIVRFSILSLFITVVYSGLAHLWGIFNLRSMLRIST